MDCHRDLSGLFNGFKALFEGVWAVHTTVIRAADLREDGMGVGKRTSRDGTDVPNFALVLRFPTLLL